MRNALFAFIALLLLPAPSPAASIHILSGLAEDIRALPGDTHQGTIIVQNISDEPVEVIAYQKDYRFSSDGSNEYGDPGTSPRSNSGWVSFSPRQFTLPVKATQSIAWTVNVPERADLRGTYWSMIMVEPVSTKFAPPMPQGVSITSVLRYGIQIATTIGNDAETGLTFTQLNAEASGDRMDVLLDVQNEGEVLLVPTVWVEIFDQAGRSLGRFPGERKRIYPACSVRYRIGIPGLSAGRYTALMVADNGDDHVYGAQLLLDVE